MLIRFSCRNYKSIGLEPIKLEMVSSTKVRSLSDHVCPSSNKAKVLRNAVIYGGNASGKSNLIQALSFLKIAVLGGSVPHSRAGEYCRCGSGYADEETTFDIQFQIDGLAFDYGFSCVLAAARVTSEWLYRLDSKAELIFERNGSDEINFGHVFMSKCSQADIVRLNVYREDFLHDASASMGSRLFLSAMGGARSFAEESSLFVFHRAFIWFHESLEIIGAGEPARRSAEYYEDENSLEAVAEVLSSFDTGISGLKKTQIPAEEIEERLSENLLRNIRMILRDNPPRSEDEKAVLTVRSGSTFLGVERQGAGEPVVTVLKTRHAGSMLDFDFGEESDGTRRLFDFIDLLFTKSEDKVFVIDELSRSFHPMLTQHLIKLFNQVHAGDDCQLVFTTHENDIMSNEYFRRDEIWFVERDEYGYSKLYPLDDFAEDARSDARLGKKYMEGRYGGVPVLSMSQAQAALEIEEN